MNGCHRSPAALLPTAAAAGLLALAACAAPDQDPRGPGDGDNQGGLPDQRYRVTATVLESDQGGPQLCHAVMESLPPQCGGPPVEGWDWDAVPHESEMGTRWGEYLLVGTWDGERFTLAEPARAAEPGDYQAPPGMDLTTPCPEPEGGWQAVDPEKATMEAQQEALKRAAEAPDYAGGWIDTSHSPDGPIGDDPASPGGSQKEPPDLGRGDPTRSVLNLRFTGDLEERESAIREVWGGPLCVTGATHSERTLRDIQRELHQEGEVLSAGVNVAANTLRAQVYVATDEWQQELDARFGEGAVTLDGWFQPVD